MAATAGACWRGEGLRLAGIGIGIGLIVAAAVTRLLGSLLFGVVPTDATVFLSVPAAIALVTLAACWLAARRAMRVDPMVDCATKEVVNSEQGDL